MSVAVDQIYDLIDDRTLEILRLRDVKQIRRRGWLVRRALLTADLVSLSASFVVAEWLLGPERGSGEAGQFNQLWEYVLFILSLPIWVVVAKLYGLYDRDGERTNYSTTEDFAGIFHLVTVITWLIVAVAYLSPVAAPELPKLLAFWACSVTTIPIARAMARAYCRRQIHFLQNTVIVGAGEVGQSIARKLLKHPEYGINLVGFVDANPMERIDGLDHLTLLGDAEDLPYLIRLLDVERVIYSFSNEGHKESLRMIRALNNLDVQVDIIPRFFEVLSPGADVHAVEGVPMWGLPPMRLSRSSRALKRGVDVMGAAVGLLFVCPILILVAVLIRADSRGPVFFRQVRMGADSQVFRIWKFRTMVVDAEVRKRDITHLNKHLAPGGDPRMFKIEEDPRVTRVGRPLRRFSIDELPQLLNVLRGEMSLVGPRPLILEEHRSVDSWARRRLDLKPGITGLWQVLGRDDIGFEEMVGLDYRYVTTWSLGKDLRLIARSFPAVLKSRWSAGY